MREAVELYKSNLDQELKEIADRVIDQQNYNDNYKNRLETFTEEYRKEIDDKVNSIQQEILRSDADLKIQNSNISDIKESVQSAIKKLNYDEIEKKNHQLANKIKYLEEVFEKFSEKELLTENIIRTI